MDIEELLDRNAVAIRPSTERIFEAAKSIADAGQTAVENRPMNESPRFTVEETWHGWQFLVSLLENAAPKKESTDE